MKKGNRIILSITAVVLVVLIGGYLVLPYVKSIENMMYYGNDNISEEEKILLRFVEDKLMDEDKGIKTNYIDNLSDGDITKGHSVLSESQGLMLLYYIDRDDEDKFKGILNYVENKMLLKNNLLSWRVEGDSSSLSSATIDDLRVVRALLIASEKWNDIKYRHLAFKISKAIKKELSYNNTLVDYNDGTAKSDTTTLCYLDLYTLKILSTLDSEYKPILERSKNIINNGFISDSVPLYHKDFKGSTSEYDNGNADMLLSTIIVLNNVQAKEEAHISTYLGWVKEQFNNYGAIYASYDKVTGKPTSSIESSSIYSMLIQIAALEGDSEVLLKAKDKLISYQVKNKDSQIYGAFGNEYNNEVYSFDNLNGLLGFTRT